MSLKVCDRRFLARLSRSKGYTDEKQWFYVFQEPWCFTLVAIKCSIGFALIRIANRKKWIEMVIYACMISCFVVMGGTGMYLFFQCRPVQYVFTPFPLMSTSS